MMLTDELTHIMGSDSWLGQLELAERRGHFLKSVHVLFGKRSSDVLYFSGSRYGEPLHPLH
jgi:hypothetical protein